MQVEAGPLLPHLQWAISFFLPGVDTEAEILNHQHLKRWGSFSLASSSLLHSKIMSLCKLWTAKVIDWNHNGQARLDILKSHIGLNLCVFLFFKISDGYKRCFCSNILPIPSLQITPYSYHQFLYKLHQLFLKMQNPFPAKVLSWGVGQPIEGGSSSGCH